MHTVCELTHIRFPTTKKKLQYNKILQITKAIIFVVYELPFTLFNLFLYSEPEESSNQFVIPKIKISSNQFNRKHKINY